MRLLLDTHIFVWYIDDSNLLNPSSVAAIRDPANTVYLSVVALWEAIIKSGTDKLKLPASPEILFPIIRSEHDIRNLDLTARSVKQIARLPLLHRDPFDRAIIAQALSENMTIVTGDTAVKQHPVSVL